jgi:hypothetical protein
VDFFDSIGATSHHDAEQFFEALTGVNGVGEDAAEQVQLVAPFRLPLDAAVVWPNGTAYFFKGDKYVAYSMNPEGALPGYPKPIKGLWPGLWECDIDAVVVWNPSTAYFFKGAEYIKYQITGTEGAHQGYPKKIADHWPGLWQRDIDAAVVIGDAAYFFKGDRYIRYPLNEQQPADPPKRIQDKWPQLWDRDIDAALVWNNGMAYFFRCASYIGQSLDGTRVNPSRSIDNHWKDLIGAPSNWRRQRFPPRPSNAKAGVAFFNDLETAPQREQAPTPAAWVRRERAMVDELLRGNMPDALLRWVTIDLSYTSPNGTAITGSVEVLPDYLAIGDDTDYVYVPLDQVSAQRVASGFGAVLPTSRICHAIYERTTNKLTMIPRTYPSPSGRVSNSTAAYLEHSLLIKAARASLPLGTLVAGHKKDVALAAALHPKDCGGLTDAQAIARCRQAPDKSHWLSYHGFYDANGWPMEPCYHTATGQLDKGIPKDRPTLAHQAATGGYMFADYSQGVRLVHPFMKVDGKSTCVRRVLAHPVWSYLISYEGPIKPARIPKPTRATAGI